MNEEVLKILILQIGYAGDIICCGNSYLNLLDVFPNAEISWVVDIRFRYLVQAFPGNIKIKIFGKLYDDVLNEIYREENKSTYDVILDYHQFKFSIKKHGKHVLYHCFSNIYDVLNTIRNPFSNRINQSFEYKIFKLRYLSLELFMETLTEVFISKFIGKSYKLKKMKFFFKTAKPIPHQVVNNKLNVMCHLGASKDHKKIPEDLAQDFLKMVIEKHNAFIFLTWGSENEKVVMSNLHHRLPDNTQLLDKYPLIDYQFFIKEMDLVICLDSSILHLANATTTTPIFSIFGPICKTWISPVKPNIYAFQGKCPYLLRYNTFFECPVICSCKDKPCIKSINIELLYNQFQSWWNKQDKIKNSTKNDFQGDEKCTKTSFFHLIVKLINNFFTRHDS